MYSCKFFPLIPEEQTKFSLPLPHPRVAKAAPPRWCWSCRIPWDPLQASMDVTQDCLSDTSVSSALVSRGVEKCPFTATFRHVDPTPSLKSSALLSSVATINLTRFNWSRSGERRTAHGSHDNWPSTVTKLNK